MSCPTSTDSKPAWAAMIFCVIVIPIGTPPYFLGNNPQLHIAELWGAALFII
jgi:hypothetical protein